MSPVLWWTVAALAVVGLAVPFLAGQAPLDLQVYLAGGHGVRDGVDLYGPAVDVRGYGFTYPPFAALLFVPLTLPPFGVAVAVAFAVSLLCLAGVLRATGVRFAPTLPLLAVVLAVLFCEPVRVTVWNGQINLVLLALLALDHVLPPSSRWRGVATGVATAIKLTPGLFVLLFLLERDRRAFVRSAVTTLVCVGVAAAVLPADSRRFWLHGLFDKGNLGDTARSGNQSLYAVAERALHGESAVRALWLAASVVVLLTAVVVVRRLLERGLRLLAWSLTGVVACLVSPVSWTHHWVWCVPLLVALWPLLMPTRGGRVAFGALALLFLIGCNKPPLAWTFGNPVGDAVVGNLYVWAGLAVLAVLLARSPSEERTDREEQHRHQR
ncbi:glycosyltransferase 87 family protein [Jatrophihabitans fulvus]